MLPWAATERTGRRGLGWEWAWRWRWREEDPGYVPERGAAGSTEHPLPSPSSGTKFLSFPQESAALGREAEEPAAVTVSAQQRGYPPAKTISGDAEVGLTITHFPRTVRRSSDLLTDALSSEVGMSSGIT